MLTIALSHLLGRGVRLETHETIALARELAGTPCGIPIPENIQLGSDGSVSCINTAGMPSVASVAGLLLTLLPAGTSNVPAPLRYAIARGLEAVEAPPFASLGEFSNALERFEKGASRDVLRGVLQRGARSSPPVAALFAVGAAGDAACRRAFASGAATAVVPPRLTLVVRKPAESSSESPQPIGAAAPISGPSAPTEKRARLCTRRGGGRMPAAAALVASFAVGFAVGDRITDRRAATKPSGSARVSPGVSAAALGSNDSAANPAEVEHRAGSCTFPEPPRWLAGSARRWRRPKPMPRRTRRAGPLDTSVSSSGPSRPSARPMRTPSLRPSHRTARRSSSTPVASGTATARSKSPPAAARRWRPGHHDDRR